MSLAAPKRRRLSEAQRLALDASRVYRDDAERVRMVGISIDDLPADGYHKHAAPATPMRRAARTADTPVSRVADALPVGFASPAPMPATPVGFSAPMLVPATPAVVPAKPPLPPGFRRFKPAPPGTRLPGTSRAAACPIAPVAKCVARKAPVLIVSRTSDKLDFDWPAVLDELYLEMINYINQLYLYLREMPSPLPADHIYTGPSLAAVLMRTDAATKYPRLWSFFCAGNLILNQVADGGSAHGDVFDHYAASFDRVRDTGDAAVLAVAHRLSLRFHAHVTELYPIGVLRRA